MKLQFLGLTTVMLLATSVFSGPASQSVGEVKSVAYDIGGETPQADTGSQGQNNQPNNPSPYSNSDKGFKLFDDNNNGGYGLPSVNKFDAPSGGYDSGDDSGYSPQPDNGPVNKFDAPSGGYDSGSNSGCSPQPNNGPVNKFDAPPSGGYDSGDNSDYSPQPDNGPVNKFDAPSGGYDSGSNSDCSPQPKNPPVDKFDAPSDGYDSGNNPDCSPQPKSPPPVNKFDTVNKGRQDCSPQQKQPIDELPAFTKSYNSPPSGRRVNKVKSSPCLPTSTPFKRPASLKTGRRKINNMGSKGSSGSYSDY